MTQNKTAAQANCDVSALWMEHKDALYRFILKRVRDEDLAKDILQDVLMKVYGFCMSKSGVGNVRSWLFQISRNAIIDHVRKFGKMSNEVPEVMVEEESHAYKEAEEFLLPIIGFLPEKYATPLRMSDIEGMKQAEIADRLGLNLSATKSRIQRARQMLKEEFITCCHLETDAQGNLIGFQVKESCKPLQELKNRKSD
jgi:RNA polymerase sigma-70 factor, ECF subfamily